ncbi:MAG: prolyl oligopeptidase family serine peptidase [Planctomycetaceae bacterium]|nr:prolyl oligopeptidase family serine peptidase [Planctomycetaceae bacterium]
MFRYCNCFFVVFLLICPVFAQPDLLQKVGNTIVDTGSKFYRFEKFELDSDDGKRYYRIIVAIPKTETQEKTGYSVIYMLDGNAVMAALNDELFSHLKMPLPVIVALGYQTELRFDVVSRAFDYTPALLDDSKPIDERGRTGGGADLFAKFIESKIKPKVESLVQINKQHQIIWGHSYGGLFVLNTLFRHPEMFQNYIAVEPSFWWENGAILKIEQRFAEQIVEQGVEMKERNLAVFVGRSIPLPQLPTEHSASIRRSVPPNTAKDFVKRLEPLLKTVTFQAFEGLNHGAMLPASLEPALKLYQ